MGTFSANGKEFTWNDPNVNNTIMTFVKTIDENTAKYKLPNGIHDPVIVKTTDGKTGTIKR